MQLFQLTLIPAGTNNHLPFKVWDEIIHPFPNFNGAQKISNHMDQHPHKDFINENVSKIVLILKIQTFVNTSMRKNSLTDREMIHTI